MKRYLYFAVFAAGMTTLAMELTASRLLGSYFGTSNLVWASIISLILIYLTVGYLIGGKLADRSPHPKTMFTIMAWGAFTAGLVPAISRPVLRNAADAFDILNMGVLFGSFLSVLILFSLPTILLGTASPFAIRLVISDKQHAGRISGQIYAVSTSGSFVGTFLPVLILIPVIGTTMTFLVFSAFLLLVAFGGLWLDTGWREILKLIWMPVLLALIALFVLNSPIKASRGMIFEDESSYNYIQVLEPEYKPENVRRVAVIGLAAGTVVRQINEVYGLVPVDGYEIDPEILEVGRRFFEMDSPNLNTFALDGRIGLQRSDKTYSLIVVDAYRPPYIPWHLTTREFFQIVADHLSEDGVMAINVGRSPDNRRLVEALVGTIRTIFPSVYVMDIPDTFNTIVYATVKETEIQNLYDNLLYLYSRSDISPLLIESIHRIVINLQPTPESDIVFTDDWAPVEWITNSLVLNYLLFGDMDALEGYQ
jgi:predicted membrane-bound spermidine synthase